ncbi:PAS domain-containing protein [Neorhizobium sp. T786]|uniref:PAS domain-containing sensor histidine kinase n=1 Tax=Pseudorhizobium xiangyangii TaxID=2883104 RepID=UPI001CFF90F8|nr:PAS domain-containing sensor histidine kinase [Neorhizobium xiangyangii]MCB5201268.1 PAS domain-containing protein [Neorhizobium xiangyangii]
MILAPGGRDAEVAGALLTEATIPSTTIANLSELVASFDDMTAFVVLTEESVRSADLKPLANWLAEQPSWSDLPFIVLTQRGGGPERNPAAARLSEVLGNVTFLERPFHATTFVSVARSALKGRRRQFEARTRLVEISEAERRLQTALEAGRLGAWELDIASMEMTTSATCRAIFGRRPDQAFGYQELVASIHPEDQSRMQAAIQETLRSGKDYAIEYRVIWPDASHHWAEIRAQPYHDRHGNVERLVGVSADITARKNAEDDLRRLNETLEERVSKRTAELEIAEEQLRQAQKLEAIGQLTGGVAHDFNNLLMAVLGNLELLGKHLAGDAKASHLIDGATRGARRGAALTQRLLAFARRQDLTVEAVDLIDLVNGMDDLLLRSIGPNVRIEKQLPLGLPLALIDSNQVELALLNLAINARDAMPDGGTLWISLRSELLESSTSVIDEGHYLVLTVADTGYGMDKVTLEKAIDPFFSTKELGKGTGLGLSMIHGLAVQLNGALKLDSTVGKGTRAELWLPMAADTMKEVYKEPPADEPMVSPALRILMVDDDALIAMSSVDMLEDLGHIVTEANSGAEALARLRIGDPFDLMITDYSMPGMNGAELGKAARELYPNLPILMASGYADLPPGSGIDLPRLGKPYTQSQLASEIGKLFRQSGTQ